MSLNFLDKLVSVLASKSHTEDWKPALKNLMTSLAEEIELSHLHPTSILDYFQRRTKLWDDFQSSLVLQPIDFNDDRRMRLACVWTYWGKNRPTLPGGRVNGPDEHSSITGYIQTSRERAAQELYEETGIQVKPANLILLSAIDVRIGKNNSKKINNHQLNFFLAPTISEKSFKMAASKQSGVGDAYKEISKLETIGSYQEFLNAVSLWEESEGEKYPFDRVSKAIELFFAFDLENFTNQRLFDLQLQAFNDLQNNKALTKILEKVSAE